MTDLAPPLSRPRTCVALAILTYVTGQYLVGLWTGFGSGAISEIHGLFYLALVIGLVRRMPVARWVAFGLAAEGLREALHVLPYFAHGWQNVAIHGALVVALAPWGRRDGSVASLAVACVGAAWFPIWFFVGMRYGHGLEPELAVAVLPLYLAGAAAVVARHHAGSILLLGAAVIVHVTGSHFELITEYGALACAVGAVLAWPGARLGGVGRLHAFAAWPYARG
jgi:hypothetical protein